MLFECRCDVITTLEECYVNVLCGLRIHFFTKNKSENISFWYRPIRKHLFRYYQSESI